MKGRVARRNVHTETPAREITAKSSRQRAQLLYKGFLYAYGFFHANIYSYPVVLKAPP